MRMGWLLECRHAPAARSDWSNFKPHAAPPAKPPYPRQRFDELFFEDDFLDDFFAADLRAVRFVPDFFEVDLRVADFFDDDFLEPDLLRVFAAFFADALRFFAAFFFDFPRAEPLLTVAHARRSASSSLTPFSS